MSQELFYTAPHDNIFEEMKNIACSIWNTYDDTYWYASEKINKIKSLENISDNFMYIFAMFDIENQQRLISEASTNLKLAIRERLWEYYNF